MTVIPDRADALTTIHLDRGNHDSFDDGHCAMEVVAWLAGEGNTDAPACASPVLRAFAISLNDRWGDEQRQTLVPFLPRMVGTAGDGQDEARSYLALDWLVRTFTPAWLDLAGLSEQAAELRGLRPIVDPVAAKDAGPAVSTSADRARAARGAAWAAAWDAAWDAAARAAWDAAARAARAAAGADARGAAWAAVVTASGTAARGAAWAALQPTVTVLQSSALDLLDRLIDPSAVTS